MGRGDRILGVDVLLVSEHEIVRSDRLPIRPDDIIAQLKSDDLPIF
jgi:hypothetical protein